MLPGSLQNKTDMNNPIKSIRQPVSDRGDKPFLVIWETTQACDMACRHCRAEASPEHHPNMMTTEEGYRLIDQVDAFGSPHPLFIFTGGDPFKRADIYDLIAYAAGKGLPVALSPSGTPLLNEHNLARARQAGTKAVSLSLDGANAGIHDDFRRVPGSFEWTVAGWKIAQQVGMKVQINTTVTRYNLFDLPRIFSLVQKMGAMTWSVFFLVPTGRALQEDNISPLDYEAVLNFLYDASKYIGIKTTEGHHFKRVVLQRAILEEHGLNPAAYLALNGTYSRLSDLLHTIAGQDGMQPREHIRRTPMHVNAGDGFVFISLLGEVFPSGYLPVSAGSVRHTPLTDIYRESELFQSLRHPEELKGRCGTCEFNTLCGGSRSRAYAMTGDYLAEEPFCAYEPGSFPFIEEIPAHL